MTKKQAILDIIEDMADDLLDYDNTMEQDDNPEIFTENGGYKIVEFVLNIINEIVEGVPVPMD